MAEAFTLSDFGQFEVIAKAAETNAKVVFINKDSVRVDGIARHIVGDAETAGFLHPTADVRDGFLRVTSRSGWEHFFPVPELMTAAFEGRFLIYDWSAE